MATKHSKIHPTNTVAGAFHGMPSVRRRQFVGERPDRGLLRWFLDQESPCRWQHAVLLASNALRLDDGHG
jgi:hypothetical protein